MGKIRLMPEQHDLVTDRLGNLMTKMSLIVDGILIGQFDADEAMCRQTTINEQFKRAVEELFEKIHDGQEIVVVDRGYIGE